LDCAFTRAISAAPQAGHKPTPFTGTRASRPNRSGWRLDHFISAGATGLVAAMAFPATQQLSLRAAAQVIASFRSEVLSVTHLSPRRGSRRYERISSQTRRPARFNHHTETPIAIAVIVLTIANSTANINTTKSGAMAEFPAARRRSGGAAGSRRRKRAQRAMFWLFRRERGRDRVELG
jgi:hypothetical protein